MINFAPICAASGDAPGEKAETCAACWKEGTGDEICARLRLRFLCQLRQDAIADFSKAIELDGKNAEYFNNRANSYENTDDYDKAIADYTEAIGLDGEDAVYFNNRGLAYADKEDYDNAIADYTKAIALDGKSAIYFTNRGYAYFNAGDYDNATADYARAVQIDPNSSFAYYGFGRIAASKGDYPGAIKQFDRSIQLNAKFGPAFGGRGIGYSATGDYQLAIGDFNQAIKLGDKAEDAHFDRGKAYFAIGNLDAANFDFSYSIFSQPDSSPSHLFSYVYRAVTQLNLNRSGSASDDFAAAIKLAPKNAYIVTWLHIARVRNGQSDAAEFAANAQKLDQTKWPWPVVGLFQGKVTPASLLAAAKAAADAAKQNAPVCEADFFLGLYQDGKGDDNDARQMFQSAASSCSHVSLEYLDAKFELERLH
jgi:tetratricopeptide (TPR) repeat protein